MSLPRLLRWSLRLDWEFLFGVPGVPPREKVRLVILKYLLFLRDRLTPWRKTREVVVFGRPYRYSDRFGLGSLQRVYCSSWRLRSVVPKHPIVVDVGANLGQFNRFSEHYLGAARVVSIEPVEASFRLLTHNASCSSDCIRALVTDGCQETTLHVAQDSQLSSVVPSDSAAYRGQVTLEGEPLADLLSGMDLPRIDLLKVDTEGSELDVLRSCGELLSAVRVVFVEMSVFRENTGNLFAIGSYLEQSGFCLRELVLGESHPSDVDGTFVRS